MLLSFSHTPFTFRFYFLVLEFSSENSSSTQKIIYFRSESTKVSKLLPIFRSYSPDLARVSSWWFLGKEKKRKKEMMYPDKGTATQSRWSNFLSCTLYLTSCFTERTVESSRSSIAILPLRRDFGTTISFGEAGVMERIGNSGRGLATCTGVHIDRTEHRAHLCWHDAACSTERGGIFESKFGRKSNQVDIIIYLDLSRIHRDTRLFCFEFVQDFSIIDRSANEETFMKFFICRIRRRFVLFLSLINDVFCLRLFECITTIAAGKTRVVSESACQETSRVPYMTSKSCSRGCFPAIARATGCSPLAPLPPWTLNELNYRRNQTLAIHLDRLNC